MEPTVSIIEESGKRIVLIDGIQFKGKRSINWDDVRQHARKYVGQSFVITESGDTIHIQSDFPDEYTGSKYTHRLHGTAAKAKANAMAGIPELIQTAVGRHFRENIGEKHLRNAKYGWYRYDAWFRLPVYSEIGEVERYNTFHASLLIRHSSDEKMYLYDVIDIKKETSNPFES